MREVVIVRAAAVSALGESLDKTWDKLLKGESATAPITHFDTTPYYCKNAATLKSLTDNPTANRNRLPHLLKKLFNSLPEKLPKSCSLIGSTLKGAIDKQEDIWLNSATTAPGSKPRKNFQPQAYAAAEFIANHYSIRRPGTIINAACASSTIAISRAASRIATGFNDCILVWGAEIISEFVFAGFASIKALSPDVCRPFDKHRNGLILGEGAAALLLMSAAKAKVEKLKPLAKISGWGAANDAVHLTAPAADGHGLLEACHRALRRAGLKPEEIAAIKAHGTATIHNDTMEMAAFSRLFANRNKTRAKIPLHSVKGALGHTLGAAGILETTISINALKEQRLPPTVGLTEPETEICGRASPKIQTFSGDNLLLTNSGFGGVNAALILAKV